MALVETNASGEANLFERSKDSFPFVAKLPEEVTPLEACVMFKEQFSAGNLVPRVLIVEKNTPIDEGQTLVENCLEVVFVIREGQGGRESKTTYCSLPTHNNGKQIDVKYDLDKLRNFLSPLADGGKLDSGSLGAAVLLEANKLVERRTNGKRMVVKSDNRALATKGQEFAAHRVDVATAKVDLYETQQMVGALQLICEEIKSLIPMEQWPKTVQGWLEIYREYLIGGYDLRIIDETKQMEILVIKRDQARLKSEADALREIGLKIKLGRLGEWAASPVVKAHMEQVIAAATLQIHADLLTPDVVEKMEDIKVSQQKMLELSIARASASAEAAARKKEAEARAEAEKIKQIAGAEDEKEKKAEARRTASAKAKIVEGKDWRDGLVNTAAGIASRSANGGLLLVENIFNRAGDLVVHTEKGILAKMAQAAGSVSDKLAEPNIVGGALGGATGMVGSVSTGVLAGAALSEVAVFSPVVLPVFLVYVGGMTVAGAAFGGWSAKKLSEFGGWTKEKIGEFGESDRGAMINGWIDLVFGRVNRSVTEKLAPPAPKKDEKENAGEAKDQEQQEEEDEGGD